MLTTIYLVYTQTLIHIQIKTLTLYLTVCTNAFLLYGHPPGTPPFFASFCTFSKLLLYFFPFSNNFLLFSCCCRTFAILSVFPFLQRCCKNTYIYTYLGKKFCNHFFLASSCNFKLFQQLFSYFVVFVPAHNCQSVCSIVCVCVCASGRPPAALQHPYL